jgi:hypothetical protein
MLHDGAVAGELERRSRSALRSGLRDDSLQHGALYLRSTFEQRVVIVICAFHLQ